MMILVAIIALSMVVLGVVVGLFPSLPSFPPAVTSLIDYLTTYLVEGAKILWMFCYGDVVRALLTLTLALYAVYEAYRLVMWVVKKIPMLGVSD